MSENENDNRKNNLRGADNWVPWFSRFKNLCQINGWVTDNNAYVTTAPEVKELKLWLVKNISDSAINELDCSKSPFDIIAGLQSAFGMGCFSAKEQISLLRKNIVFPPTDNPNEVYRWLNGQVRIIEGIGGNVTNAELKEILLEGLTRSIENDPKQFYQQCKSHLFINEGTYETPDKIKEYIQKYWNSMVDDQTKFKLLSKTSAESNYVPSANFATIRGRQNGANRPANRANRPARHCNICATAGRNERVFKSHDDKFCRNNAAPAALSASAFGVSENKEGKNYFDTGCTPTSFVKDRPLNIIQKKSAVLTASGSKVPTLGKGTVKFGEIVVDATYVPSFQKNLISGIDIMNKGYSTAIKGGKMVIASNVVIPVNAKVLATGELDNSGLLALDGTVNVVTAQSFLSPNPYALLSNEDQETQELLTKSVSPTPATRVSPDLMHKRLGHIGSELVKRTVLATSGITLTPEKPTGICGDCVQGKLRKKIRPQIGKTSKAHGSYCW